MGVVVYSRHKASEVVTKAFAHGTKWKRIPVSEYKEGPIALYGLRRGLLEALRKAQDSNNDWFLMDHGYLHPGHFDGHYSVTKNAFQHTGEGEYDSQRLDQVRPELKPMRHGEHILLLPPSRALAPFIDVDVDAWIEEYKNLPTDRTIKVREKPKAKDGFSRIRPGQDGTPLLEEELYNCHAVVTYNSKAAIKAAIAGVSVFATQPCCVSGISGKLSTIDNPDLNIDREGWLRALCYHQFTLDEMRKWDLVTTY